MPTSSKPIDPEARLRKAFGATVSRLRKEAGLSQERLAEAADLSISYIGLLERGERNPTIWVATKLGAVLGMEGSALIAEAEQLGL